MRYKQEVGNPIYRCPWDPGRWHHRIPSQTDQSGCKFMPCNLKSLESCIKKRHTCQNLIYLEGSIHLSTQLLSLQEIWSLFNNKQWCRIDALYPWLLNRIGLKNDVINNFIDQSSTMRACMQWVFVICACMCICVCVQSCQQLMTVQTHGYQ